MSSSSIMHLQPAPSLFTSRFHPQRNENNSFPLTQNHRPLSRLTRTSHEDHSNFNPTYLSQTLARLHSSNGDCMNDQSHFDIDSQRHSVPPPLPLGWAFPQELTTSDTPLTDFYDWQPPHAIMGGPVATPRPLKRARSHQRTPSASTVASTGPSSPFAPNNSCPQIANSDYSPESPTQYSDTSVLGKGLRLPLTHVEGNVNVFGNASYMPSQIAHTPDAHMAMKGFAIDHHISEEFPPDFYSSSRPSISSLGRDSPTTPQSGSADPLDNKMSHNGESGVCDKKFQNEYPRAYDSDPAQTRPNVQLERTESQAYQDELYNPNAFAAAPVSSAKQQRNFLSPHRNLVTERVQTANLARSVSPTSAMSRHRSPFREGSRFATTEDWKTPITAATAVGTASNLRREQKEQAEQNEYAQHRPQLKREPTKTISPKDAMLEYNESGEQPLFQETLPVGYKPHTGGTELWPSNSFIGQTGTDFGGLSTSQQTAAFRSASTDGLAGNDFSVIPLPQSSQQDLSQITPTSPPTNSYIAPKMEFSDSNPEFPANLTSMESSISESNIPPSSQESFHNSALPQRPVDTRANTGTYTCTYHGCTQRFESHASLQRHKRDFHRAQQQKEFSPTSAAASDTTSPRSTESPAPSASDMSMSAILARNSQAGPHRCTRINPSTNKPCNTIFSRPYDLTRHEDTIHNNRKQKVRCPMCREEKTFSRSDALTRHLRVVHPEVETYGKRGRRGD